MLLEHDNSYPDVADVVGFVDAVPAHGIRVLAGLDTELLRDRLATAPAAPQRPILFLNFVRPGPVEGLIEQAVAGLACAAADLWPFWWNGEDFSKLREDASSALHLPIRLTALARRIPELSPGWAREAMMQLVRKRLPRVRQAASEIEFAQLCHAYSPAGLVLVTMFDKRIAAEPLTYTLEWMAAKGNVTVLLLTREMLPADPPYERLLFGARKLVPPSVAPPAGEIATHPEVFSAAAASSVLAIPEIIGRPHPLSPVEQKIAKLIDADIELRPLFSYNRFVTEIRGPRAKVDLLWNEGRVVVEFDGDEHGRLKYRTDRHRDYELLCAGYLVLRITNAEVLEDAGRAIEKIRDVVRLRHGPKGAH